jgi:DNA (cytosine-5)-methyltransferase 1
MRHGSLFSGVGGWSVASDWMGWKTIFNCEINPFGQKVLKYYWPKAELYGDIKTTDFRKWRGQIDIITNSFPCQPFSVAGKRKGTDDNRYLWEESIRAIREVQPEWAISENVPGLITWAKGMVFDKVQIDLEDSGYEVIPFLLPACSVNAPHKRERIWFIAHSINGRHRTQRGENGETNKIPEVNRRALYSGMPDGTDRKFIANNNSTRSRSEHKLCTRGNLSKERINKSGISPDPGRSIRKNRISGTEQKREAGELRNSNPQFNTWSNFPTQSPLCSRDDGISSKLDGITFPKWRNESIKGYGNAVCPQVVLQIFKAIQDYEDNIK